MESKRWCFQGNQDLQKASSITIGGVLAMLRGNLNKDDPRPLIPLGHGDPSCFPSFRTASAAVDAIVTALQSNEYNSYAPIVGVLPARRAIADHLNRELPYKLSPDDVYLTVGCRQAIEISLAALNRPGANILLPRPGFPTYESYAASKNLEVRHFNLLPEKEWEVDLDGVEALADDNTIAMVIINPGNPCGNVYSYDHLKKVAETASKLGILVIADEVYDHLTFGTTKFVPMGVFGSIVPVLTLGAISKRWLVPGWRLGWIVTTDPNGILKQTGVVKSITSILNISQYPATFIQGAIPQIIENTKEDFFTKIIGMLREGADICCNTIDEIPCISCPKKPEGGMFVVVKLDLTMLEGINDDVDFCMKLANEENVLVLPGAAVGMKNYVRITFACELSTLEDGLTRIKAFCKRHTKISPKKKNKKAYQD